MKVSKILVDISEPTAISEVLNRYIPFFEWKLAGLTLLQRLQKRNPKAKIYLRSKDDALKRLVLQRNPSLLPDSNDSYDEEYKTSQFFPWILQQKIINILEESLSIDSQSKKFRQKFKVKSGKYSVIGKEKHLYIHPEAQIYPGVVFDTSKGPIVIEEKAKVSPFSFLEGPLYVGSHTQIDNAKIGGGTLIGSNCRIGGEVENSIILDYSNKHHEGFLGHSFVASWVNLGALATTSDLKNNYGIVKLKVVQEECNTGTIKFGSIITSFSKIAIGTMLNTGTVIDLGANLVSNRVSGYIPAFSWIDAQQKYELEAFLKDSRKIMARRNVNLTDAEEDYLREIYSRPVGSR